MCTQPCTEYSCWKNTSSSQDNLEFLLLHWSNVQSQVSSASSSVLLHVCMHTHVSYKFEIRHFWMHMVDAQDMESTNVWSRETRYNYGERNRCLFLKGLVPLASTSYTRTHASTPSRPFLHFPPHPLLSLSHWAPDLIFLFRAAEQALGGFSSAAKATVKELGHRRDEGEFPCRLPDPWSWHFGASHLAL